jgi:FAD synthase
VVYKQVCSIGKNITFGAEAVTVEVHLLGGVIEDFYGSNVSVTISGFIRPMTKFNNITELVAAISNDILIASGF